MSDNVLQTLQKLVQDVIAPDVRETKVRLESLTKEMNTQFDAMQKQMDTRFAAVDQRFAAVDQRFNAMEKQISSIEKSILAAIAQLTAQSELATMSALADVRERVAVLESQRAA